jgi:hypothetical protein
MKNISSAHLKFVVGILLSALMAYAIGIYGNLPWWSFVVTNFIISIAINQKPGNSFLSGALGIGLLWLALAFVIDNQNHHILSTKVANILPLKGSFVALIAVTSIVGFLLGGLASLTGAFVRKS